MRMCLKSIFFSVKFTCKRIILKYDCLFDSCNHLATSNLATIFRNTATGKTENFQRIKTNTEKISVFTLFFI